MDSLDPESDFLTMLGMFRQRIEGDLNRNQIELIWQVDTPPLILLNSPEKTLQAIRVVQEAIANTIKYAHASEITVVVDQSCISIFDNGIGIQDLNKKGRGLQNIKWRSEQLDAQFVLNTSSSGTEISLFW